MFKRPSVLVFCLWAVCFLLAPGCAGGDCDERRDDDRSQWSLSGPDDWTGAPGSSQKFTVRSHHIGGASYELSLTAGVGTPGWTVTMDRTTMRVDDGLEPTVEVTVNIPAGATPGDRATVWVKGVDQYGAAHTVSTRVNVGTALTTGISKTSEFINEMDGVQSFDFKVVNGVPGELIGSLLHEFVPGVLYWYRPDNILDMGVNTDQSFELAAIATDSEMSGPFNIRARFEKSGTNYEVSSAFTPRSLTDVNYRIQPISMGLSNNTIGWEANFQVTVKVAPGKAGIYTLAMSQLGVGVEATVSPASQAVDAAGSPVTFDVTLRRTSADPGQGFRTHEFLMAGEHDSKPETNFRQIVPVSAFP
jgi:hypothetical protein